MKNSKQRTNIIIRNIFAIVFLLLFLFLCFVILNEAGKNGEESTKSSSMVVEIIQTICPSTIGSDMSWVRKVIGHYALFATCAFSGLISFYLFNLSNKKRVIFYAVIAIWMILMAMLSEWMQTKAEGRGPSWNDVGIDSLGSLTAFAIIALLSLLVYLVKKHKRKASV